MFIFLVLIIFIFGLIIGSFLNCLIWRLYKSETLWGRSYCPHCRQSIAWYDNIPVFSFIFLKGKCRFCKRGISWQYPLVEIISASLFLLAFVKVFNPGIEFSAPDFVFWLERGFWAHYSDPQFYLDLIRLWILSAALIVIAVYDGRFYLISNLVIVPVALVVFLLSLFLGTPWFSLLLFTAVGVSFFGLQFLLTRGRGIGEGDIWLGGLLGLAFPNFSQFWLLILLAYLLGSLVGGGLILAGKKAWRGKLPLGSFLALGALITLFWGERLLTWYQSLFY